MATGTPRRSSPKRTAPTLTYPGKASEAEILARYVSHYQPVRSFEANGAINSIHFGENASVLEHLLSDVHVKGKVKLVYIDPPFATQSVFHSRRQEHAYEDLQAGSDYLEFLRERLILLRELMADDGSIYVHLDGKMIFHAKVVMDEIFGPDKFRNCIVRKKCNPKNYTRRTYGNVCDFILFYTKSDTWFFERPYEKWTEERAREYQYVDEDGRRYMKVPLHAPGVRAGATGQEWRGKLPPPGKHWQYPPATLDEMDARGEIYWSSSGNPRRKVYLDSSPGVPVQDLWLDFRDAHNQNILVTGYPTEKPAELLKRIILASSQLGDLVLDCFSGSGTTGVVAQALGRRWLLIDESTAAIKATLERIAKGTRPMGDFVNPDRHDFVIAPESEASFSLSCGNSADARAMAQLWHGLTTTGVSTQAKAPASERKQDLPTTSAPRKVPVGKQKTPAERRRLNQLRLI